MKKYNVPGGFISSTGINSLDNYLDIKDSARKDPSAFWDKVAERIDWFEQWDQTTNVDFLTANIQWFVNGKLNASYNCLDRHVQNGLGEKVALIWQSNDINVHRNVTYKELLEKVSQFSNALKKANIQKGDRVCIYM